MIERQKVLDSLRALDERVLHTTLVLPLWPGAEVLQQILTDFQV